METSSRGRRGRPYIARYCSCGAEALYAVQVLARNVGPGSGATRKIKPGRVALLCGQCSRNVNAFIEDLGSSSVEALNRVRRPGRIQGTPLFDQAEA